MVVNSSALLTHIIMPIISVTTAVGTVAVDITVAVIVSQHIADFLNSKVVLQSPAIIVLDRLLESNELPFFYDVLETMDVFLKDVERVLRTGFGNQFVKVEFKKFSPTPIVTSNNKLLTIQRTSHHLRIVQYQFYNQLVTIYQKPKVTIVLTN